MLVIILNNGLAFIKTIGLRLINSEKWESIKLPYYIKLILVIYLLKEAWDNICYEPESTRSCFLKIVFSMTETGEKNGIVLSKIFNKLSANLTTHRIIS